MNLPALGKAWIDTACFRAPAPWVRLLKPYLNITSRLPRVSLLRVNLTRSVSLTLRTALNAQAGAKAESIRSRSARYEVP